jgi:hypothetical protein
MSCADLEGMESQLYNQGPVINTRWIQHLNRDNVPCLRTMPNITLPNPLGTAVFQDNCKIHSNRKNS